MGFHDLLEHLIGYLVDDACAFSPHKALLEATE